MSAELALRLVALAVWLAVGSPVWTHPETMTAVWVVLYMLFAVAMWFTARRQVGWLVLQSVCAVVLAFIGMPHFEGALLALVAAQAAWFFSPFTSIVVALVQAVPLLIIIIPTHQPMGALKATGEYLAFALFATLVGYLRMQERTARLELARERAVLLGTQSLLEDGARVHERMRLAREVHDAIGHGLTAVSVNLQLASRTGDAAALESARTVVHDTLTELRALVSGARERSTVDLGAALRALAAGMRDPHIVLELPGELDVRDERRAHALFRLVQESVTNAVKHGKAKTVRVSVEIDGGRAHVHVRDDGIGANDPRFGNGLMGLRERLAEVNGDVEVETKPGEGFHVHGWVTV
jgi:signal transduction histidine kinase